MSEEKKQLKAIHIIGIIILVLLLAAGVYIGVRYGMMKVRTAAMPSVDILAPLANQPAIKGAVNPVRVQAIANGQGISTLEWYLDGILAGRVEGDQDVLIADWQWLPDHEGSSQLSFLAYAENGAMGLASLDVAVLSGADVDADGVPNALDACPSEAGPAASYGCILPGDDDRDGLIGEDDLCPDAEGTIASSGCPLDQAPDSDGDGIFDAVDRCPGESGFPDWGGCSISAWSLNADGDELPDFLDDCPDAYGPRDVGGCPLPITGDADGDGTTDVSDACADSPGSPAGSGCPLTDDRDGDGIADSADSCPDDAGLPALDGCPPGDLIHDLDLDAVPDVMDICPSLPGHLDRGGCPLPDDRDGDAVPDADDRCVDLPGSPGSFGCPMLPFPINDYNAQFSFLPVLPRFGAKWEDDFILYEPELTASMVETSIYIPQADDRDGDGVLDDEDDCQLQIGRPQHHGCPFPEDWDSDGIPDDRDPCTEFNGSCENPDDTRKVSITITGFRSDPDWEGVYCYATSNRFPNYIRIPGWEYYEPILLGTEYPYNLFEVSRFYSAPDYVTIRLNCWGQPSDLTRHSQYLGEIYTDYHIFFWDGQVRKIRSYGPGGWFEIWIKLQQLSYAIT